MTIYSPTHELTYSPAPQTPFILTAKDRSTNAGSEKIATIDAFNHRVSLDEASLIFQAAKKCGLLDGASSAIFHHLGLMRARIAALRDAFPPSCLHTVAIKANPVGGVLREIVQLGAGLEAASIEEVELALAAGCPSEQIVFDSPAKTLAEIRRSLELGVYLNADNFDELARIAAVREQHDSSSVIGLRINTMVGAGAIAHTSVSAANSKFGVPLQTDQARILAAFAVHPWLTGLHIHVGSQGCNLEQLSEAAARIASLRQEIARRTGRSVPNVDIGGGLPTSYQTGEPAPTPAEYRSLLEQSSPELFTADVRLITEFGRAVHANCGIAASRVEYTKPAQQLAVIHLGADFLLPSQCTGRKTGSTSYSFSMPTEWQSPVRPNPSRLSAHFALQETSSREMSCCHPSNRATGSSSATWAPTHSACGHAIAAVQSQPFSATIPTKVPHCESCEKPKRTTTSYDSGVEAQTHVI